MSTLPAEPWPVWEDSYINSYRWNDLKVRTSNLTINKDSLTDLTSHGEMPMNISVSYWERPNFDDRRIEWVLSSEDSPLDLIVNNSHLMKNNIMVSIISSIQSLEELGQSKPFEPDHQGQTFYYNGGPNWKPWNHIYYMTKAGKGSSHVLKINKSGLYIVRLFYMGHWRRIVVDDFMPYNEKKELCLPCSRNRYNIWPQILTKALFQIASLSWGSNLVDFSVVSCLTGWTHYVVDCRNLSIDTAWKLIQMYMVEDSEKEDRQSLLRASFCRNNPSDVCRTEQEPLFCSDSIMWRNIFAVVSETEDQLDRISPAEEHMISFIGAEMKHLNDLEELPAWKKFRWVEWARDHGGKRGTLGIIKRIVKVFSPFRKFQKPNPYSEENIQNVSDKVIAGEITTGNLKDLLIAETERTDLSGENNLEKNKDNEKLLEFDFSTLYPFIREFHIYYKSVQFKHTYQTSDIEVISFPTRQSMSLNKTGNVRENLVKQYLYLYSESKHCKDFFITLSTYIVGSKRPKPYITCEEYNWKSQVQGNILFDLSTFGTITSALQLGNSVQVCRLWYSLPAYCYFSVFSYTPFEILNEDALQLKLTTYSDTFFNFGENIAKTFEHLKQATLNSSEHYRLLNIYKKSFYPPSMDSLTENEKNNFIEDFNKVFDECLAELIFEEHSTNYSTVACLEAQKVLFSNNKVFAKLIDSLNIDEKSEIQFVQDQFLKQQLANYSDLVLKELNSFKKDRNVEGEVLIRASSSSPLTKTSAINDSFRKKLVESQLKVEDIDILSNAKHNVTLLRKILNRKNEYLYLYPFKNEHELKLQFVDYGGSGEFIPLQKWHLIARFVMNVHSTSPVPCRLVVKPSSGKISSLLFDMDSSKLLSPSFNGVYYITRNKVGYGILLYICPTEDMLCKPVCVKWSLRITGIQRGDILHACYRSPLLCRAPTGDNLEITSQSISGFYIPNFESVIGRFQIKTQSSPLVTLFVSIARSDLWIRIVIRGEDVDICSVEGKGSILIPVLILDKNVAVKSTSVPDVCIFKGEIQLMDSWKLTPEEQLFVQYLRSIPEKDTLSFEDFDDCPADLNSFSSEEADLDEIELNFPEKPNGRNLKGEKLKVKPYEFNTQEISSNSDLCLTINKREFESEPYGLLTYSPYWRISLFIDELNKEDTVILHDDQRLKEFEMFEMSWEENYPGRGKMGEQLRNDFLRIKSKDILKMELDPDELSISDFSECGIDEDFQSQQQAEENEVLKRKSKQKKRPNKSPTAAKSIETDLTENPLTSFISNDAGKLKFDGNMAKINSNFNNDVQSSVDIPLNSNLNNVSALNTLTLDFKMSSFLNNYSSIDFKGENYSIPTCPNKLKLDGREITNKQELVDMPTMSLLSELPPISIVEPVFNLYSTFCLKNEPMLSPETTSLTMKLIKNYSQNSECLDFNYFDPVDFNFQEPQFFGEKNMSYKELNGMYKHSTHWETLIETVLEPSLYPLSKRKVSSEIFVLPGSSKTDVFISETAQEQILNYKREADELIEGLQRWILSKTRQGSQVFYPLTLSRSQTYSEKLKKMSEIGFRSKTGTPKE